jgi:hypothetical protein
MSDRQAPPGLDADEERAAVAGRTFARTQGLDVADNDTRYRMRKARVGARRVDVYSADGDRLAVLGETPYGWIVGRDQGVVPVAGGAVGRLPTFADAVIAAGLPPLPPKWSAPLTEATAYLVDPKAGEQAAAWVTKPGDDVLRKLGVDMVRVVGEIGITPAEVVQNLVEAYPDVRVPRVYRILGEAIAAGELVQPRGSGCELFVPGAEPDVALRCLDCGGPLTDVDGTRARCDSDGSVFELAGLRATFADVAAAPAVPDGLDRFARLGDVGPVVLDVMVAAVDARTSFLAGVATLTGVLDDARPPVRQAFAAAIEAARGAVDQAERVIAAYAPLRTPLAEAIAAVEAQRGRGV